jgi:hypothetical protein
VTVTPLDAETCECVAADDSLEWLAVRLGMIPFDFEVHEPPELVERFKLLAARYERAAAGR